MSCDVRIGRGNTGGIFSDFEVYCLSHGDVFVRGHFSENGAGEGDPELKDVLLRVQDHMREHAGPCTHEHVTTYTAWNGWTEDACTDCGANV